VEESRTKQFNLGGKNKKHPKPAEGMVGIFCNKTMDNSIRSVC
jgi:hypothetical protein